MSPLPLQADLNSIYEWSVQWGMKFNPSKCVVMTVSNKQKPLSSTYYLKNMLPVQCLLRTQSIKYLGVRIDNKLTFKTHIETKCTNATKVLNLLRRNLHFAPSSVKAKAYMSCVRPIIEYASTCWSPSSLKLNHQLEMVQNRAAKFVTNTYPQKDQYEQFSVTSLIDQLGWDTLETRRSHIKLSMAYKILNNQVILPPKLLPRVSINRVPRTCNQPKVGFENQLVEPQAKLLTTGKTFFFAAPRLWNKTISQEQANAPSSDAFKKHFSKK